MAQRLVLLSGRSYAGDQFKGSKRAIRMAIIRTARTAASRERRVSSLAKLWDDCVDRFYWPANFVNGCAGQIADAECASELCAGKPRRVVSVSGIHVSNRTSAMQSWCEGKRESRARRVR